MLLSPGFRPRLPTGWLSFRAPNDKNLIPMPSDSQFNNQAGDFDNSGMEPEPPLKQAGRNQKLAAAGLAVFAVLIVILWSVQLKNNIYGPLNSNTAVSTEQAQIDSQTASDLALKNKDTDGDGLSDYDELNIYHTSPYLADSDSDGINDGSEVKNGTDPNCPQGRTCAASGVIEGGGAATSTPALPSAGNNALNNIINQSNTINPTGQPSAAGGTAPLTNDQIQVLKTMDAASLRQLLLEAGMPQADLDKISDAELMQSYNETLSSQGQ